ncbi:hypothetical protein CFP65_2326 [Kitasatospora sp. MMS16-BH015]|uniref:hypothetical protein n=1 Tax=Kitasatospora sp. MMS16-BH015 TaxID=2018025 RepID=UPI000CA234AD|nr:hypothetical protein [Kitasatospora sp. MMS16-BH015]AUG77164.1 hypothetical protein CFP65_2326 [Kitasatospora sp. MMS16-BH015]
MLGYTGSGPYCFTNSLAMVLGAEAPSTAVIETLTGSPFGAQLIAGELPLFDPYGWHPEIGLDSAIELLGWVCERSAGGGPAGALERLRAACASGPALVGPVDMGLLLYQPGTPNAEGGDHYVVVLAADEREVELHDPHGHPYATMPTPAFLAAWEGKSVGYLDAPYVLRTGFTRVREVTVAEALRRSLPAAERWLAGRSELPMPPGSLGGAAAVAALADRVERGLPAGIRTLLTAFAVRVGARRRSDAAGCLAELGLAEAAAVLGRQARLLGGLQYPLVQGEDAVAAARLRELAPSFEELRGALGL